MFSVFRCECPRVRPDPLWGPGDDSGSTPGGAAPAPTAGEQQQRFVYSPRLGSQLETKRRRVLALPHTSQILREELEHCSTHPE